MGKRIKLTRTDVYLLVLTALFCVGAAALWAAVPKTAAGDYLITAAEPGIGPVLAQRIVDWRTENGPFQTAEDLLQVEGIGPATLENLQSCIITEEME